MVSLSDTPELLRPVIEYASSAILFFLVLTHISGLTSSVAHHPQPFARMSSSPF